MFNALTKKQLIDKFQDKKIDFNSKDNKKTLVAIANAHAKKMSIANATSDYYFRTKVNTYSAHVARAIALQLVNSTLDIRKHICSKYSFRDTLNRLHNEHMIEFTNARKTTFKLTQKAQELSAIYKSRYESKDTLQLVVLRTSKDAKLTHLK